MNPDDVVSRLTLDTRERCDVMLNALNEVRMTPVASVPDSTREKPRILRNVKQITNATSTLPADGRHFVNSERHLSARQLAIKLCMGIISVRIQE